MPAWAQGYSVYQQGACEMGRAGAGVAAPCDDGSAIFYNPAGLSTTRETVISIGATAVPPRGTFTNDAGGVSALNKSTSVVPTIYVAKPMGHRLTIGGGIFAPYGLASDWPATGEGRYIGYFSSVKSAYVQPTIAMRLTDRIQIGAGLDITRTSVELRNRLDLASVATPGAPSGTTLHAVGVPAGTDFADIDLTGSATSVGGHFGLIVKASDHVSIGARYLTRQTSSITNGRLRTTQIPTGLKLPPLPGVPVGMPVDSLIAPEFADGQTLGAQSAKTSLPLPDQFVVGVAVRTSRRLTLLADYQFTNWSLFNEIDIRNQVAPETAMVQSYVNTHGIRLGGDYAAGRAVTVRAGFATSTAGAPDQSVTPIIPDAPRQEFTTGATVRVFGRNAIDLAYQFAKQQDRRGRTTDGGLAVPTADLNNGVYHLYGNLLGASWSVRF